MAAAGPRLPEMLAIIFVLAAASQVCVSIASESFCSPGIAVEGLPSGDSSEVAACEGAGETEEAGWLQVGTIQREHARQVVESHYYGQIERQAAAAAATASAPDAGHPEVEFQSKEQTHVELTAPHGVKLNDDGDIEAFWSALAYMLLAISAVAFAFSILRLWYPRIYSHKVLTGAAPPTAMDGLLGWFWASTATSVEDIVSHAGLDQAMLLEFTNLGMKVAAMIGVPMICVFGPVNYFFGGDDEVSHDHTWLSLGNVRSGSPLWWVYAFVVWGVVLTVQISVYRAQQAFLELRFKWLRALHPLRANTVLVEGIPEEYRSERGLFKFFEDIVSGEGNVERAYIVKDTSRLAPKVKALREAKAHLREAELIWQKSGGTPDQRPELGCWPFRLLAPRVDSIRFYRGRVDELEREVRTERQRLAKAVNDDAKADTTLPVGFVTFYERAEAELALRLYGLSHDSEEWRISTPPCPSDVQWADFMQDPRAEQTRTLVGYLLVIGLYFAYMPLVVSMTNLAKLINMGPLLQPYWESFAPSVGLQFMVAFLPTFLLYIFRHFFTLKAASWAQRELQDWYFWFQMVYVVLATAVGRDITGFIKTLLGEPLALFTLLAQSLPRCTHFFMNYIIISWMAHASQMARVVPLLKFLLFRRLYSEEEAREMAEPEDQDYYGLGARTVRSTIMFVIMLLYGTLSPLVNVLVFINFAFARLFYGYLIPFAETRKPDLGGAFWVAQLRHVLVGLVVYCILMTGVLDQQAGSRGPVMITAPSILYVLWSMRRFETAFIWEKLPFQDLMLDTDQAFSKHILFASYLQPELEDSEYASSGFCPPISRSRREARSRTVPKDNFEVFKTERRAT